MLEAVILAHGAYLFWEFEEHRLADAKKALLCLVENKDEKEFLILDDNMIRVSSVDGYYIREKPIDTRQEALRIQQQAVDELRKANGEGEEWRGD